jgi:adenosylcobinamide-GDP ribazoletransferase
MLGLPVMPAAALALAATVLVTGALHEDGLADTADGFGGGATATRKLEIMRDSRIGTYGVLALLLSLLLRWSALVAVAPSGKIFWVLLAAHAASRALIPTFMAALPSARSDGLSANAGTVDVPVLRLALLIGFVALLTSGFWFALVAALILALCFFGLRALADRQIGGQTGDVLGALQQICEIAILLTAAALFRTEF